MNEIEVGAQSNLDIETAINRFHHDGYVVLKECVDKATVRRLRELADHHIAEKDSKVESVRGTPVLRNTQSLSPVFSEFLAYPPLLELAEAVLGPDVAFCGQNVIRSRCGEAISNWHVDDILEWPLPDSVAYHDRRVRLPLIWFSVQIALSDITSLEHGPTEVVPGSHRSGRWPPSDVEMPVFEGTEPEPLLCQAGDVYLFNHQLWHRGHPNKSKRTRYLMQNQYCAAWIHRRFGPGAHRECQLPEFERAALSPKAQAILRV